MFVCERECVWIATGVVLDSLAGVNGDGLLFGGMMHLLRLPGCAPLSSQPFTNARRKERASGREGEADGPPPPVRELLQERAEQQAA